MMTGSMISLRPFASSSPVQMANYRYTTYVSIDKYFYLDRKLILRKLSAYVNSEWLQSSTFIAPWT